MDNLGRDLAGVMVTCGCALVLLGIAVGLWLIPLTVQFVRDHVH